MEQKSYYAIIPANVRYDKNLPANAKLLYGEITSLCNEKGFCWATNKYFADLYDVSKDTVSHWISLLVKFGYIATELIYKENSKEIAQRRVYLKEMIPIPKKQDTYPEKTGYPIPKNTVDNNKVNNKIEKEERAHAETAAESKNPSQQNHNTLSTSSTLKKQNWSGGMSSDDAAAYLDRPQIIRLDEQTEAEKIYREIFPTILLSPIQNLLFKKIENLDIWRKVCELWRDNGSRASMLGNMVDRYNRDLDYFKAKNHPGDKWNHELAKQPKPKKWSHSLNG